MADLTHGAASEILEFEISDTRIDTAKWQALIEAKQALDILATLERTLDEGESIEITNRTWSWDVKRGHRIHQGSSITDALAQLCQTLMIEEGL